MSSDVIRKRLGRPFLQLGTLAIFVFCVFAPAAGFAAPAVANDDAATTAEETAATINVLQNDTGSSLTVIGTTNPTNGSVAVNGNQTITYTPGVDFNGSDSFTYDITDLLGGFDSATVTVTVTPVNDPPAPANDAAAVNEDASVTISVLANDQDVDGDTLTVVGVTNPTNGSALVNADSSVTYTPNGDFYGNDTFIYTVSDGNGGSADASVAVSVIAQDDAPVATNDIVTVDEDTPTVLDVLANDTDADGNTLTVLSTTSPTNGSVAINPDNTITYTPAPNFNGSDSFAYVVIDDTGLTDSAGVSITVNPVNDAPIAADDSAVTDEDNSVTITVLPNDFDVEGDTLSVVGASNPPNGTSTVNADNTVTYVPDPDFNGNDSFAYTVSDGNGGTDTATFSVTVIPVNDAPAAANDVGVTNEDSSTSIAVLVNDADVDGDPLTLTLTSAPTNGVASVNAGATVTYTPAANFNGGDSFTYRITDPSGASDTATVNVTVFEVNDAPFLVSPIVDVTGTEDVNTSVNIAGVFDDVDIATNSDVLNYSVSVSNASLVDSVSVVGDDVVIDVAADQNGGSNVTVTATDTAGASVSDTFALSLGPVNDAPYVMNQIADLTVSEDAPNQALDLAMVFGDVDIVTNSDSLVLTVAGVSNPSLFDAVSITGTMLSLDFAADQNGSADITMRATDQNGSFVEDAFTVTVDPVGDTPYVAVPLPDVAMNEDEANRVIDVSPYFYDVDIDTNTDSLSYSVAYAGAAVFDAVSVSGNLVTLDLAQNMNGSADVTVRATDSTGLFVENTFTVAVSPVNDAPFVAIPIADLTMFEDGPNEAVDLSGVFDDVDLAIEGDTYIYTVSTSVPTMFDALTIDFSTASPQLVIDLADNQNGPSTITVFYTDQGGLTASDDFVLTVTPMNDTPIAQDDFLTIAEDTPEIVIDVLANDFKEDAPTTVVGAGTSVIIDGLLYPNASESVPTTIINALGDPVTQPNGTVYVELDYTIKYIPKKDFNGTDFFTYTIRDADGDESVGRVNIEVTPVNDAPYGFDLIEYTMVGDTFLHVVAPGLLLDARDVDGDDVFLVLQTLPANGGLILNPDGSFVYTPDVGFVGTDQFTYFLSDSTVTNTGGPYVVSIDVTPPPPPPIPPPPGEVEFDFQLADLPLELAKGTDPNVVVLWDDSGSMDWSLAGPKEIEGRFLISTALEVSVREKASTFYSYVHDVSTNRYPSESDLGRVVPSEESIAGDVDFRNNKFGIWRVRNHKYNRVYYNPAVQYVPWPGLDPQNQEFGNANPTDARLNPIDWRRTIDLTQPVSYMSGSVPCMRRCRIKNVNVADFYIPRYYLTPVDGPDVAWNDPHTLVEIRDDGTTYQGGPNRADCAVDDDNPLTCTYAQEIQNFANWFSYYRSREYAAKYALGDVVATATGLRVGYAPLNDANDRIPLKDMNATYKAGNKRELMDQIYRVDANGSSPIRSQLDRVGRYYECLSANIFHQAGSSPGDPNCPIPAAPLGECQVNYALVFTDGRWNQGLQATTNWDADADTSFDGGRYSGAVMGTLGDIAMSYYERDLHPTLADRVPTSIRDRAGAPAGAFGSDEKTMHQHMKTFGIQFGLTGHLNDTDIPGDITQPVNWGDPFADPDAKTDDVRHAAVNGRGFFLTVFDPQELAGAMTAAFDEFSQAEGTASAVAFNSQQIREGNLIFRGFYDSAKNTGDLVAQELDADGFPIDPPVWSAAEELDDVAATDRTIVTFDSDPSSFNEGEGIPFRYASLSGEQQGTLVPAQVDYLRGDRSNERPFGFNYRERPDEEGMLGDIINSTPVYIGPPSALDRDRAAFPIDTGNLYSEFKNAYDSREAMVAVGANDGMLHVFNADTGEEMLAYIPDKIINGEPYANPLFQLTSLGYNHKYFVDLTPAVNDVFAKGRTDFTRRWRTVLVGGLRGGGKGYFALDLTDPSAFDTEGGAADKVLWEFTDADDVSPNPGKLDLQGMPVKDLGYTYSQPTLVMTNAEVGAARKRWAAVFGNGYNSTAGIAKLFALFIEDGVDGWSYPSGDFVKIDTGFGAPGAGEYNEGLPNGLGTPRLIDIDQNGTADIAYAGDMRGNLFRFDLRDVNPGNWDVTKVFTATYPDGAGDIPQPITTQPIVLKNPQDDVGYIVVFSTGSYITEPDGTSEEIQSIYGVWDRLEDNPQITRDDLVEQEIINLADPVYGNLRTITQNPVDYMPPSTLRGWYVDLDAVRALNDVDGNPNPDTAGNAPPEPQFPGERAIRNLQLRGGFLFVNTVIPRDDESCEASPGGFQMAMNPATGGLGGLREEVAFDLNNDGYFDDQDRSGGEVVAGLRFEDGVPTDSAFIGNRRYTQLSSREVTVVVTNTETGVRTGRLSWKEMPR